MGDVLGYARVSTTDQDLSGQRHRLEAAGAIRISRTSSAAVGSSGPGCTALLDFARRGDALCVVRLDRLGRSLRELLETVDQLKARGDRAHVARGEDRHDVGQPPASSYSTYSA